MDSSLQVLRHTASHVLAQAVSQLYPGVKLGIGPAIEQGFYYDFTGVAPFTPEQLTEIEREMKAIIKKRLKLETFVLPREEALQLMQDQPFKQELIRDLPEDAEIRFYRQGDFVDLCAGPHCEHTGCVKAYKLLSATGAYWRGDSNRDVMCRVYGTAFDNREALDAHLTQLEEARKRDHNRLGRELEYFTTVDYIGQGLPILMPKGTKVIQILQRFVEDEEEKRGYQLTKTPLMAKSALYRISGHWDHYREGMFIMGDPEKDDAEVFALRPMTCPFQFQVYLARTRSYRDLPMRFNETSTLFRNEASGEMHGLIRVRQFTISEGHLACTPEQLEGEFAGCVDLAKFMLEAVGLNEDVSYRFSKWDPSNTEKYIGNAAQWEAVQAQMKTILDHLEIPYEEAEGEAAFYGPKLDIQIRNVHGKEDTLITIQIDFQLAERFGMEYTDQDGQKKHPYVIHRTSIGCYERTLALLIEKYAGHMPLWLAPVQAVILPITDKQHDTARTLFDTLKQKGFRVELDDRNEKIGYKIREARMARTPYMLVIGAQEQESGQVAVRSGRDGDLGVMSVADFIRKITEEVETRAK